MKSAFFCDFAGTFSPYSPQEIKKFVNLLGKLDKNNTIDFSFITSNTLKDIEPIQKLFETYIQNTKIKFRHTLCRWSGANTNWSN